jgi:hypothetical protein
VLRSVLKRPHRALLALGLEGVLGESGSQSRRFYDVLLLRSSRGAARRALLSSGGTRETRGPCTQRACMIQNMLPRADHTEAHA